MFLAIPLLSQREGLYVAFRLNPKDQARCTITLYGIIQCGPKTALISPCDLNKVESHQTRMLCAMFGFNWLCDVILHGEEFKDENS